MYDDLVKALQIIKDECIKHDLNDCSQCPMGDAVGKCLIGKDVPFNWKIIDPKPVIKVLG